MKLNLTSNPLFVTDLWCLKWRWWYVRRHSPRNPSDLVSLSPPLHVEGQGPLQDHHTKIHLTPVDHPLFKIGRSTWPSSRHTLEQHTGCISADMIWVNPLPKFKAWISSSVSVKRESKWAAIFRKTFFIADLSSLLINVHQILVCCNLAAHLSNWH